MRRIFLGFGIAGAVLLILAVLLVKTWGTAYAWDLASARARAAGIELTREELSWSWNGGLGFALHLRGVGARTVAAGPASFALRIERIDVVAAYVRARELLVIDELTVSGVSGKAAFTPAAALEAAPEPAAVSEAPARIPDLRVLELEIPKPPLDVELRAWKLDARGLEVSAGAHGGATLSTLDTAGALTWKREAFSLQASLSVEARDLQAEAPPAATLNVAALNVDARLEGSLVGPTEQKLRIRLRPDLKASLEKAALRSARGLAPRADRLALEARLTEEGPFLKIAGAGIEGLPGSPGGVGLSATVTPKIVDGGEARIGIDVDAPGLLRARGRVQLPRELARAAAALKGDLQFEARGNLLRLLVPDWPEAMTAPVTGSLKIARSSAAAATVAARLSSSWLKLALDARARLDGASLRDADADGHLELRLPGAGARWQELRAAGGLRVPLKLLFRDGERFYVESNMEFHGFSFRRPGLALEGVDGAFFVSQSWAARRGSWRMAPVHAWNPFSRVDLASSETLDPDQKALAVARISYGDRAIGPLRLSGSFRQNQLFVPSWSLACPQGRFQGVLLSDVRPDQPRVGLSFNAIEVDLSRVLPDAMTGGRKVASDPTSFVLNVDWDVARAQAFGGFEWLRMTPGQVHAALDVLDPLGEKPAFNLTRSMLGTAYPTRVRLTMKGAVADAQVSTNLVEIPPITNVAISPYLVKYREAIFAIPFVKSSRQPEVPE